MNTDKLKFVAFLVFVWLHLSHRFRLPKISRNQTPSWFLTQNNEKPRIFRVTGANQNAQKLLFTDLVNTNFNYSKTCLKRKKLSLERDVLHEIWTIFSRASEKWVSGNFAVESILKFTAFSKLKTKRNFNRVGQNVLVDLKVNIFNSQNRCKVVVPDELGREVEHFNSALFRRHIADSHTNPYCQFANLFTETNKSWKVRINVDSFSLTKILMELVGCRRTLMPVGQFLSFFFFFRFSIFSQSFLRNENCIDIF